MPLAFELTGGEASDTCHVPILLPIGPDLAPRAVVCDKGYDRNADRSAARDRGIGPVIPLKRTAKNHRPHFPKALHRARARIEQAVGKLKRFKRVTVRCEKTAQNYRSITAFAFFLILARSGHSA